MNKDIDAQFLCKDCERYNLCRYYDRRKEDSYICKYFHLSETPKQKMGHWIPVSERLPEVKYDSLGNNISDYVLLWVKKGDYETYKIGYFSPPNCFDAITSDGWVISVCALKDVIAWMPLPEPYLSDFPTGSNSEEGGGEE